MANIKCMVEECAYNCDCGCKAPQIDVCSCGNKQVNGAENTECSTFRCK